MDFRRWNKKSIKNKPGLFCTAGNFDATTNNTKGTISFVSSLLLLKEKSIPDSCNGVHTGQICNWLKNIPKGVKIGPTGPGPIWLGSLSTIISF